MNKLFNIIGFQASWWGCVLGVQAGMTYLGPFLMFSFLAVHIIRILDNYSELKLIILFGFIGTVIDTGMAYFGILIYNGTVDVVVDNKKVAELKDGQFVGEMSFLTEKTATATCIVKHNTECLVWKQPEFKELLKRNPSLYYTIQSLLSNQLVSYSNKQK